METILVTYCLLADCLSSSDLFTPGGQGYLLSQHWAQHRAGTQYIFFERGDETLCFFQHIQAPGLST